MGKNAAMHSSRVLGRAYTLHILDGISEKELTFTRLLKNLGISRGALATTLEDLVASKLVNRRKYGRHVYYSITEEGLKILHRYSVSPDFLEEKIMQTIYSRLAEKFPEGFSKRQVEEKIRPRIRQFMDMLAGDITKDFSAESKKPSTKAEMFGGRELPAELAHVADASTIELLRKEIKRIKTLKQLSNPQTRQSKIPLGKDEIYMGCKTTRIFCRLTCPCKMPRIENLRFFRSAEEAVASDYRACKVCKPL